MSNSRSLAFKAVLLAAVPSLLTGCANNFQTTAGSGPAIVLSNISGKMHGGSQPILGATINLYAAGTTGYGSAGTLLATTTSSSTDSSFSFTQVATQPGSLSSSYACPSNNSEIYLIGSGGNTQGTGTANNSASVLMAAIGPCVNASNIFVNVNEITTVASVFALQQYINPGNNTTPGSAGIGTSSDYTVASPSQSGQGLINQFALVPKLVDFQSGNATASFTQTNTGTAVVAGVTVTATPEQTKINTIADIIASCVNQVSSTSDTNCSTLFTNAPPPTNTYTSQPGATFKTAIDTLQATYYMATNPTDGGSTALGNLYVLASPTSPFQSTISAQPTDWTIGIVYNSGSTTCTNNGTGTGSLFINYGYGTSIDASGNVWMANGGAATSALTEMSPLGVPMACSTFVNTAKGGAAIDTAGNVWATSTNDTNIYKYIPSTGVTVAIPSGGTASYGTAADGKGNIFFDNATAGTAAVGIYELPSTATASSTPSLVCTVSKNVQGLAVDYKGTVYSANNNNNAGYFCPTTTVGGTVYSQSAAQNVTSSSTFNSPVGVALDSSGNVLYTNSGTSAYITKLTPAYSGTTTQTVTATAAINVPAGTSGLTTGRGISVDGAGNFWVASNGSNAVVAFAKDNTALLGSAGITKSTGYLSGPRFLAVDMAGNVWVTQTGSTSSTIMTEIVGAAVPVVTPISAQLSGNKIATKP